MADSAPPSNPAGMGTISNPERAAQVLEFLRQEPAFRVEANGALRGRACVAGMCGRAYSFELEVDVPSSFPHPDCAPMVRIVDHDLAVPLTLDAHVFPGGTMCLQVSKSGEIPHWRIGLVGFMKHVALHLDRIVIWKHSGIYPGPAVPHGITGLEQYYQSRLSEALHPLLEEGSVLPSRQAPCPCGSEKRFSRCCQQRVENAVELLAVLRKRRAEQRVPAVISSKPVTPPTPSS